MRSFLWSLAIILGTASTNTAQDTHLPSRLYGKVTDKNGAAITVAAILVHPDRRPSGPSRVPDFADDLRLQVDQRGEFSASLPPGVYDVVVFAPVFSPQCAKLRITAGGGEQHDFVLRLEPIAREVDY
jgi:hypothetical protein